MGLDYQLILDEIRAFRKELESRIDGLRHPFDEPASTAIATTPSLPTVQLPTPYHDDSIAANLSAHLPGGQAKQCPTLVPAPLPAPHLFPCATTASRPDSTNNPPQELGFFTKELGFSSDDFASLGDYEAVPSPTLLAEPQVRSADSSASLVAVTPSHLSTPDAMEHTVPISAVPKPNYYAAAGASRLRLRVRHATNGRRRRPLRRPLGRLKWCGRRPRPRLRRHRPHATNERRRRLLRRLAWRPPWRLAWCGRHPRLRRHRPHACRGAASALRAARRGGGRGLRPLPRRLRSSSPTPPTVVTSSPAPTPPRDAPLMVLVAASSRPATISIHALGVFDEMPYRHQPSTSSEPAPVLIFLCAALTPAVVLHARAADQSTALSTRAATMAPASTSLSVLTSAHGLLGSSFSRFANHPGSVRMSDGHETDRNIEIGKIKKLIKALESARGNSTSMISLIMSPRGQIARVTQTLGDEYGTASNIKSRVIRRPVLAVITSAQQRLKLYNKVPSNGLVLYTGAIVTEDGKEKKVTIAVEPFKPIKVSLYLGDNKFHTEVLNELLESDDKFGFLIMEGLILAGATVFRIDLSQSDMFDQRLQAKILHEVDVSYGGENGFNQAIELSAEILANVKFIQEKKLIGKYFEEISQDTGKYVVGGVSGVSNAQFAKLLKLVTFHRPSISCLYVQDGAVGSSAECDAKVRVTSDNPSAIMLLSNVLWKILDHAISHDTPLLTIYAINSIRSNSVKAVLGSRAQYANGYAAADIGQSSLILCGKSFVNSAMVKDALTAMTAPILAARGGLPVPGWFLCSDGSIVLLFAPVAVISSKGSTVFFPTKARREPKLFIKPNAVIIVSSDSTGTIPSISKLSPGQAAYHFLAGYHDGKFVPTYSRAPSPADPLALASSLFSHVKENDTPAYLINAQRSGQYIDDNGLMKLLRLALSHNYPDIGSVDGYGFSVIAVGWQGAVLRKSAATVGIRAAWKFFLQESRDLADVETQWCVPGQFLRGGQLLVALPWCTGTGSGHTFQVRWPLRRTSFHCSISFRDPLLGGKQPRKTGRMLGYLMGRCLSIGACRESNRMNWEWAFVFPWKTGSVRVQEQPGVWA